MDQIYVQGLREAKVLLDDGVFSQDEFDRAKANLDKERQERKKADSSRKTVGKSAVQSEKWVQTESPATTRGGTGDSPALLHTVRDLQARIEVKKEAMEEEQHEHARRHAQLQSVVEAKMKEANELRGRLNEIALALECGLCFEKLAAGSVSFGCGHTYCNRPTCGSSSVDTCPECRLTVTARVKLFGALPDVGGLVNQEPAVPDLDQVQKLASECAEASLEKIRKRSEEDKAVWQRERGEMQRQVNSLREELRAAAAQNKAGQKKQALSRDQASSMEPPSELVAEAFICALETMSTDERYRDWPAERTIMLRMTSKRVKEVVDRFRAPAIMRMRRNLCIQYNNFSFAERLERILLQLAARAASCRITTLELCDVSCGGRKGHEAFALRLAGVLAQCPALVHLNLRGNWIGAHGAWKLAGVLAHCPALAHLNLSDNYIGPEGAGRLAGVLAQWPALSHLNLSGNSIGTPKKEFLKLAGVLSRCLALAHLNLGNNIIGNDGVAGLVGVLPQFPTLTHLDLRCNAIYGEGAGRLASVLPQCQALSHLNLSGNLIMYVWSRRSGVIDNGAGMLAGVLAQCPALAQLDLRNNGIKAQEAERLRGTWRGPLSGLLLAGCPKGSPGFNTYQEED
jgi:Ran GTPase-activating protein (RanGAP) involved in mRNA processing and transport